MTSKNRPLPPEAVAEIVRLLPTHTNAQIAAQLDAVISPNQINNIRRGRAWSSLTGIKPGSVPVQSMADRQANIKHTDKRHPLYAITASINDGGQYADQVSAERS